MADAITGTGGTGGTSMIDEHRKIMQMQQEQSIANMKMQAEQHAQTERLATISNMLKNKHESSMTIINNSKS